MNILLEEFTDTKPILVEAKDGFNLRFQFMEADKQNLNKRTYPLPILSHAIEEAQAKIDAGASLYGSTDHQVKMGLDDVSHRLLKLEMRNKEAWAEAAVLPTTKGKNLAVLIKAGGSVGVSARGLGTVEKGVVQEGYILHGVDCVLDPSFNASVSKANIFESESFSGDEIREGIWWASEILGDLLKDGKLDEASLKRRYEEAVIHAGFKGTLKEFVEAMAPSNVDEKAISALFENAMRSGFKKSYVEFRKEYLARRKS